MIATLPPRGAGRFAPTPTGRLHLGNARTALLAWLDARKLGLRTVLRVEDLDPAAIPPGCLEGQYADLDWLGLAFDEEPRRGGPVGPYRQSERAGLYREALQALDAKGLLYPCWCSRREVHDAARAPHASDEGPVYARTCAPPTPRPIGDLDAVPRRRGREAALRLDVAAALGGDADIAFDDAIAGPQRFALVAAMGDFIVRRRDGVAAYQLACAWDDAAMGCTRVLRGADLLPSTARQGLLLRALGLPTPVWAHAGLVVDATGQRLAKRDDAIALEGLRAAGVAASDVRRLLARLSGLPDTGDLDLLTEAFHLPGPEAVELPAGVALMRRLLQAFIDERVVLAVITFNLVVLFARSYPSMHPHDAALFVLDYVCLVYFVGEMVTKISLFGWRTYWASGINRFDFVIVAASAPTLLAPFTHGDELTVVLVFRAARLLRFLRVLRFIPHADQLWAGIGRALRASVGLILAIVLYLVVMGLIASHLFGEAAPDHFADPVTSIYSIFKVFTVEGWYTVPDLIAETQGPLMGFVARGFFTIAVVTGGLLGLGITNAVLVDEMVMDNNDELEERITGLTLEVEQLRAEQAVMLAKLQATVDQLVAAKDADG